MNHITKLINLLQVTRLMPQYGYVLGGIKDPSNLAEHHYLVTMIGWQLARMAKTAGANIDIEKVLEFTLIHDLGELFGGDISMPYAKANPEARKYAKLFESENHKFLSKFFGGDQEHFNKLSAEILNANSDESRIAKIADYMEVTHYKYFVGKYSDKDLNLAMAKIQKMLEDMKDKIAKEELQKFILEWSKEVGVGQFDQQIRLMIEGE